MRDPMPSAVIRITTSIWGQVTAVLAEFWVRGENHRRPTVTPPISDKELVHQCFATPSTGGKVQRRFTLYSMDGLAALLTEKFHASSWPRRASKVSERRADRLGTVTVPDSDAAIAKAIDEFKITDPERREGFSKPRSSRLT
jgi:hypothetical protein